MPVANGGFQHRELRSRKTSAAPLPPGWSRSGGSHFKHDSDAQTTFKYPVPVPPQQDAPEQGEDDGPLRGPPPPPPPAGPLLAFKTTAAFFDVDYAISMAPKDRPNPPVAVGNIWSRSDRWVGEFRAHDGWLGVQTCNYDGDEKLEFIAISTAMERRGSYVFSAERVEEHVDSDGIMDIAVTRVLLKAHTTSPEAEAEWMEIPDEDMVARTWALKILVNRLRSYPQEASVKEVATPIYTMLNRLVKEGGEASKKKLTPLGHKNIQRLLASQFLLKLSCIRRLDSLLTTSRGPSQPFNGVLTAFAVFQ